MILFKLDFNKGLYYKYKIYFENNTKFYNELKEITKIYKDEILNLAESLDNKQLKEKVSEVVNFKLNLLFVLYIF